MQTLPAKDNSIFLMIELMLLIEQKLGAALAKPRPGPISKLSDLELLTILAFDGLVEQHQSLRGIYNYIAREYSDCFRLPTYIRTLPGAACCWHLRLVGCLRV